LDSHFLFVCLLTDLKDEVPKTKRTIIDDSQKYFVLFTISLDIVSVAIVDGVQLISISSANPGCIRCVGDVF